MVTFIILLISYISYHKLLKNTATFNRHFRLNALSHFFLYIILINVGNTTSNKGKAIINPPITAIANGWCSCAPVPIPSAIGMSAMMAPSAVIKFGPKTGRNSIDYGLVCVVNFLYMIRETVKK